MFNQRRNQEDDMAKILEELPTSKKVPDQNDVGIGKIVVAVDLSTHSEKTASYAAEFGKSLGASITLVHVFSPEMITEFSTQKVHESYEEQRRFAEQKLDALAEKIRKTYPDCDTEFRIGNPADEIELVASRLNADLIVTASHHPSFLARLLGADQAPRILHRATCPVLVYHERRNTP
jgi:nucleotide-binding universal stress UspA family protein